MSKPRSIELSLDTWLLKVGLITSLRAQVINAPTSVEYTVVGAATARGVLHRPKYSWEVTALMTETEAELIKGMFLVQDRKRRLRQPLGITLVDRTERFVELAPTTRAIAPGDVPIVTDGLVAYFAAFSVLLSPPELSAAGRFFQVSFTAVEIENIA